MSSEKRTPEVAMNEIIDFLKKETKIYEREDLTIKKEFYIDEYNPGTLSIVSDDHYVGISPEQGVGGRYVSVKIIFGTGQDLLKCEKPFDATNVWGNEYLVWNHDNTLWGKLTFSFELKNKAKITPQEIKNLILGWFEGE